MNESHWSLNRSVSIDFAVTTAEFTASRASLGGPSIKARPEQNRNDV